MATPNPTDIGAVAGSLLPNFSANIMLYFIIGIVVFGMIGAAFYLLLRKAKFDLLFTIFKDVNGKPCVVDRLKGMEMVLGKTGERVLFVKKYNKYLPLGNIQAGVKNYWYYIDKAGHWHNFALGAIDVKKRDPQLDMQLQMDYAKDGINKRLEDRHDNPGFWAKWGAIMVSVVVLAVLLVFLWLIIRDSLANNSTSQQNMKDAQKLQLEINKEWVALMTAMDNVCSNNPQAAKNYLLSYQNVTGNVTGT